MGNPQLEDGYTKIANELMEALGKTYMSSYESQIIWILFRKTYGYMGKKNDWIANSQFVELTGIHKANVSRTIKKLISRNIVVQIDNKIGIQKDYRLWSKLSKQTTNKKVIHLDNGVIQTDNSVIHLDISKLSKQTDTKDIITKENIQKIIIQKRDTYSTLESLNKSVLQEISEKYNVPLTFVQSKLDDLTNWHEMKPHKNYYANYKRALMDWVKKDALKITNSHKPRYGVTKL